jgi:hypothetical protein
MLEAARKVIRYSSERQIETFHPIEPSQVSVGGQIARLAELTPHPLLASLPRLLQRPVLPDAGDVPHGMEPIGELRERAGEPEIVRIERSARLRPRHVGDRTKLTDRHQSSSTAKLCRITSASSRSYGRAVSCFMR